MQLIWLDDYLALARTLNFSRAAELRHVTQPAFSRRIRALETWAGAALFTRTTHSVELTPAGEHVLAQAQILSRALQQLRRETREIAGRGAGPLSIAATHALSFTFFPKWVRANERLLALGHLNLVSDSMQACEEMMLRGDAVFLLCHVHPELRSRLGTAEFQSLVVGADTLVPVSAPGPDGAPLWSLQPGAQVRYLAYSAASGLGRIVATRRGEELAACRLETAFTSHLAATLLPMARAGEGVAWLPRTLAEDDLAAGRLVEAGPAGLSIPIEIRLFRPRARQGRLAEAAWATFGPG